MTCTTITSADRAEAQRQLDDALTESNACIHVETPAGVWLTLTKTDSATVEASGSATVRASGSATVEAWDSATVRASGSATVRASGSATVRASGSATVEASGSATVRASGSATVRASGSATVRAWDSATVRASPHVAVHLLSARARVEGGVLIDVTKVNDSAAAWAHHHGVEVFDGEALLFKAVDGDLRSGHGMVYPVGEKVSAPDWQATHSCGNGLHFSPSPWMARTYFREATRFLKCAAPMSSLRPLTGGGAAPKCKSPECRVLAEVDIDGNELAEVSA